LRGLKDKDNKFANIGFYSLGLCLIIVLLMFFSEEHDHGDHDDHDDHEGEDDHDDHEGEDDHDDHDDH